MSFVTSEGRLPRSPLEIAQEQEAMRIGRPPFTPAPPLPPVNSLAPMPPVKPPAQDKDQQIIALQAKVIELQDALIQALRNGNR